MYCIEVQRYVTIRGGTTATIAQSQSAWRELTSFTDLVAWLDVREVFATPSVAVSMQTSVSSDEAYFVTMATQTVSAAGLFVLPMLFNTVTNPLARWFRWLINPSGSTTPWDLTFRLFLAANAPGRKRHAMLARQTRDIRSASSVPLHVSQPAPAPGGLTLVQPNPLQVGTTFSFNPRTLTTGTSPATNPNTNPNKRIP